MPDPYIGQVSIFSFIYAPKGWALCNGQLLGIAQNQALFSLLGTTFGGDGRTTFALPNLQGRIPTHRGNGLNIGEAGGEVAHTLTIAEMPGHDHGMPQGSTADAGTAVPIDAVLAAANNVYTAPASLVPLQAASVTYFGQSGPHENMQPYLTLSFCIALVGVFPPQN